MKKMLLHEREMLHTDEMSNSHNNHPPTDQKLSTKTFYNSTVSCPFFVPLSVLFLLCTTYPIPSYPSSFFALCNIILCKYIITSSSIYSLM